MFKRRFAYLVISLLAMVGTASAFLPGHASAYSGNGYFSGNTGNWTSDCYGDVFTGRRGSDCSGGPALGASARGSKNGFITFIKNNLSGSGKDKVGAAFVINEMVNADAPGGWAKTRNPSAAMIADWESRIRNAAVTIGVENRDPNGIGNGKISFYDSGINDDFYTSYNADPRNILIFRYNGTIKYAVEVPCGNPIGGLPGLPEGPRATLKPKAQLVINGTAYNSDQTVPQGTTVQFRNWVQTSDTRLTGTDTFRYRAVDTGPGNLPPAASLGPNDYQLNPNRDVPNNLGVYSFNTTGLGGRFCRETRVGNYPSYVETPNGATNQICVTVLFADCNISLRNNEPDSLTSPLKYDVTISTNPGYTATLNFSFADDDGYTSTATQTGTNGQTKTFNVVAPPGGFGLGNATGSVHITIPGASGNCDTTNGIYNRPYLSIYGGDVIAGTSADASQPGICTYTSGSGVTSWNHDNNPANDYAGAGGRAAVFASGNISHFSSGLNITNLKPAGLSFGNDAASGISLASKQYGGRFGGKTPTSCDFDKGTATPLPGSSYSNGSFSGHKYYTATGNVYISGNVVYSTGGWAQLKDIPSFKLVVTGGNIYIDNNVTELDGLYVSIPSGGAGGHIYTCATGASSPVATNTASYYPTCNHRLTIQGSFVAKKIHFDRTAGTLSQAVTGDTYATDKAAEQFIYGPEMWLPNGSADGSFRPLYYQGLPPVL